MSLKQKSIIIVSLWLIGAFSVAIHFVLQGYLGVPHPSWAGQITPTGILIPFLKILGKLIYFSQVLLIIWLAVKINELFHNLSKIQQLLLLFVTVASLNEILIRLPLTAGYTVDQKFLFLWLHDYGPRVFETLITCALILMYVSFREKVMWARSPNNPEMGEDQRSKKLYRLLLEGITLLSVVTLITIFQKYLMDNFLPDGHSLLMNYIITQGYILPPNPENILQWPYPWQVVSIAMSTFVEVTLGSTVIGYVLYKLGNQSYLKLSCLLALMIIVISGHLNMLFVLILSEFEIGLRILSVLQFTLEYVFIAAVLPYVIYYIDRLKKVS